MEMPIGGTVQGVNNIAGCVAFVAENFSQAFLGGIVVLEVFAVNIGEEHPAFVIFGETVELFAHFSNRFFIFAALYFRASDGIKWPCFGFFVATVIKACKRFGHDCANVWGPENAENHPNNGGGDRSCESKGGTHATGRKENEKCDENKRNDPFIDYAAGIFGFFDGAPNKPNREPAADDHGSESEEILAEAFHINVCAPCVQDSGRG